MPAVSQPKKLFSLDDANRTLPLVSRIVGDIVRLSRRRKKVYVEAKKLVEAGQRERAEKLQDVLQALHYECAEYIKELEMIGCELKQPEIGLVDFPAQLEDRVVWLCWKMGEPEISHWHELDDGFDGRQPAEGTF